MTGTAKHKLIIGHLEMLDIRLTLSSVVQKLKQRYPNIELEYRSYRDYELPQALHDNRIVWQSRSDRRFSLISL